MGIFLKLKSVEFWTNLILHVFKILQYGTVKAFLYVEDCASHMTNYDLVCTCTPSPFLNVKNTNGKSQILYISCKYLLMNLQKQLLIT